MLKFYTGFEINDQTGNALTQKEMTTIHYEKITSLQVWTVHDRSTKHIPGVLEERPHYGIFLCLVVTLTTAIIHSSSKATLICCVFCREQLLFISQICKTLLCLMLQPLTRENPWTRFLGISGKSNHLESLMQSWGTQTRHQRFHVQNLFMVSFFLTRTVWVACLYCDWSLCFNTASARPLMPDFPAKWQLVSPRTGSCYQPESTARLINLIDLHWLENKLFEQLCLSDPISSPKSQKSILNLRRPACECVCTCA